MRKRDSNSVSILSLFFFVVLILFILDYLELYFIICFDWIDIRYSGHGKQNSLSLKKIKLN